MNLIQTLSAVLCVTAISAGQLLFKWASLQIQIVGSWISWRVLITVGLAAIIYVLATLLWINLLQQVALNKAYVFMALSFVLVPIASYLIFREPITNGYLIGAILVIIGIMVATQLD
ncbi:MAG: EamA family transporter [Peptococcaceae bacterium]|nr:EamA family transporter [Peptococcaceae bacterium]